MEHQLTFADSEFSCKRRQTRKEIFLSRMDSLLPWAMLLELIEPVYPKDLNIPSYERGVARVLGYDLPP